MHDYSGALHAAADLLAFSNTAADQAMQYPLPHVPKPAAPKADAQAFAAHPFQDCLSNNFLPLDLRSDQPAEQPLRRESSFSQRQQACDPTAASQSHIIQPTAAWAGGGVTTSLPDPGTSSRSFRVSIPIAQSHSMLAPQRPSRTAVDRPQPMHACFVPHSGSKRTACMSPWHASAGSSDPCTVTGALACGSSLHGAADRNAQPIKLCRGVSLAYDGKDSLDSGSHGPTSLLPDGSRLPLGSAAKGMPLSFIDVHVHVQIHIHIYIHIHIHEQLVL